MRLTTCYHPGPAELTAMAIDLPSWSPPLDGRHTPLPAEEALQTTMDDRMELSCHQHANPSYRAYKTT